MELTSDNVGATWNLDEQTYYFCSQDCKERFMESPEEYIELIENDEEENYR